jgi:hypothetical protein
VSGRGEGCGERAESGVSSTGSVVLPRFNVGAVSIEPRIDNNNMRFEISSGSTLVAENFVVATCASAFSQRTACCACWC